MKKIGTFSTAVGLIYFGIWMIINTFSRQAAAEVFRWWYIIIVLLGAEFLLSYFIKEESKSRGFNFGFILVLVLFFSAGTYNGINSGLSNFFNNMNNGFSFDASSIVFEKTKVLEASGSEFVFEGNNVDVEFKKSEDNNIKIESKVYVNRNIENYEMNVDQITDGYSVNFKDKNISGVKAVIYLPDGYNIKFNSNNIKFKSDDENLKVNYDIKTNNGTININNNAEILKIDMNNGTVSVNNKLCKTIDIKENNGTINFKTKDTNISVNIDLNLGLSNINGNSKANSGIGEKLGTGEGTVNIKLNNGTVTVKNQ